MLDAPADLIAEGRAELVIEVRSPGDESYQKLPFYERVGIQEVLIIDRDTKALRHWIRDGDHLIEAGAGAGTTPDKITLRAVDARLHTEPDASTGAATLVVETATGTHRV